MMTIFTPNKTSAKLLVEWASKNWYTDKEDTSEELQRRFLIVYDLYIKARSYALINKAAFWLAILAGLMVLIWPSIAIVTKDFGVEKEFLKSAIVQTTVTGIAALTFSVYSHYKKRQMYIENLIRFVVYSKESEQQVIEKVLKEIAKIDTGLGFSGSIINSDKSDPDDKSLV